mmetsp:Transcript_28712/g.25810  ORF Transcript_28712/g.25810 Transcript_28712/m.25810 type:complete len:195 (-) Transcript_28712:138-722(-)
MHEINDHEKKLFGIVSPFDNFVNLRKELAPYFELWKTVGDFLDKKKSWMSGPFLELNHGDAEMAVKLHTKNSSKLNKLFKADSIAARIAQEFREDVLSVNEYLPAMEILSNQGLKDRHWAKIDEIMGTKFNPKTGSLQEIWAKGVKNFLPQIEEISETASKEYRLESMLNKMEKEWEDLNFVISNWKNSNVLIL